MPHVTEQSITFAVRKDGLRHDWRRKNVFLPLKACSAGDFLEYIID